MVEGVVPIGSGSDSPGPLTVKLAPPAGHEERRGHAGGRHRRQDLRCARVISAGIKAERDRAARCAAGLESDRLAAEAGARMIAMGRLRPRWLRRDPGARMRRGGARARTAGEHDDHDRAVSRDRRLKRTPRKWESCSRRSNRSSGRRLSMKRSFRWNSWQIIAGRRRALRPAAAPMSDYPPARATRSCHALPSHAVIKRFLTEHLTFSQRSVSADFVL